MLEFQCLLLKKLLDFTFNVLLKVDFKMKVKEVYVVQMVFHKTQSKNQKKLSDEMSMEHFKRERKGFFWGK
ncbi:hypothetical protein [Metabacillus fastidiosus]|uniref:hypothetical protein n=1 Tax=Metabacillus fastidiosus TaxID=1458 RepID=UPI002DBBBFE7|nr:hypothetical protein [Metabacillus fastidiosus]MEC2078074.1 hypothetical protein [Metabacillus fastidiosus]